MIEIEQLAKSIDHTNLQPDAIEEDIRNLCIEAVKYNFAAVYVNPVFVKLASALLKNSTVRVGTTVAFPLGATATTVKCFETINNVVNGAQEIDFVINIGFLKTGKFDEFFHDLKAVVMAAKRQQIANDHRNIITKAILECCYLSDEEIKTACKLLTQAGVDFAKTSTGMGPYGATEKHVELLRRNLPSTIGVKASGGIRTAQQAVNMMMAGACRIGTSAGVAIIKEYMAESQAVETK